MGSNAAISASHPVLAAVCPDEVGKVREQLAVCRPSAPLYPYPAAETLRRSWGWHPEAPELKGASLSRVAHHESGHIVLMEWAGLSGMSAQASPTAGRAFFPAQWPALPDPLPDPSGKVAATCAAIFHAGLAAELIYTAVVWRGPVLRLHQVDHQMAERFLLPSFGRHSSGAHAFAQRLALHVLQSRWARVEEIARELIEHGIWGDSELKSHSCVRETSPIGREE